MRKQQVGEVERNETMKKRERAKKRGGRGGGGRGGGRDIGQPRNEGMRGEEGGREGEGDYRRRIAAQEKEGEEINKGAKIERGEGMLGLGACLEALQLLSIRMRRLRIEVAASCSVENGPAAFHSCSCGSIHCGTAGRDNEIGGQ